LRFQVITFVGSNQGNYFENATACSKRTLKTRVATQLNLVEDDKSFDSYFLVDWKNFELKNGAFVTQQKNLTKNIGMGNLLSVNGHFFATQNIGGAKKLVVLLWLSGNI